jgi:hypothetical protein
MSEMRVIPGPDLGISVDRQVPPGHSPGAGHKVSVRP